MKTINNIFIISLLISIACSVPIAVFHGLGDNCNNPGMKQLTKYLSEKTGNIAFCAESGTGFTSSFNKQSEDACELIKKNKDFQGDFHVIGLSQGGLIARYIAESCDIKGKVVNLISVGGPQMGVSKFPHCVHNSLFCKILNSITDKNVYNKTIQDSVGPAGYFRYNKKIDEYIEKSSFLSPLNNEREFSDDRKSRLSNINKMHLIMFSEDTMIIPKETAWFGFFDEEGHVLSYKESNIYKNDLIGIKKLDEENKIQFSSIKGDHLQFKEKDIDELMIPDLIN